MTGRIVSIFSLGLAISCASTASAALLHYDSFEYDNSVSTSLGTAGVANWTKNGASPDPTVQSVGNLNYPGLLTTAGTKSLQYDGSGINAGSGAPAATDAITLPGQPYTTGSLYYSLLLKVPAVQVINASGTGNGFASGVNLTQGSFMAGLMTTVNTGAPAVGTSAAPLLIVSGDGLSQFGTTYRLGTSKTATAVDRQFAPTQFSTGPNAETVFVVLKYTFDSVNGDSAQLFLNPTPGAAEPAASLTVTAGTALNLGTPPGIKSFFVRNNSVEPDELLIDELRIGTTWEDVTPAVPEPASAVLALASLALVALLRRRG
jgi:hypothetical protein